MDIKNYYVSENEKPLDKIVDDGGFCAIFRSICCIGDSLSSGEFQTTDAEGNNFYYDRYEYSWGQYIARMTGSKVYNFSRGGMTAKEYIEVFADKNGFWSSQMRSQAYIIALGVNDLFRQKHEIGDACDIVLHDYTANKKTFAGYYGQIIQKIKEISPDAKMFFMTMPKEISDNDERDKIKAEHSKLMYKLSELFKNSYVIDLYKYAPVYDEEFKRKFYLNGHMNACGYLLTAKMVASYIDYIIRSNFNDFITAGLIGTGINVGI